MPRYPERKGSVINLHRHGERLLNLRTRHKRVKTRHVFTLGSFLQTSFPPTDQSVSQSVPPLCLSLAKGTGLMWRGLTSTTSHVTLLHHHTSLQKHPLPPHACAAAAAVVAAVAAAAAADSLFSRGMKHGSAHIYVQTQASEVQWISMWTCEDTRRLLDDTSMLGVTLCCQFIQHFVMLVDSSAKTISHSVS